MYEKAYEFLKFAVKNNINTDDRRFSLIKIVGEESIGFWAILDQILFFEDLIEEITGALSQASTTNSRQSLQ